MNKATADEIEIFKKTWEKKLADNTARKMQSKEPETKPHATEAWWSRQVIS